MYDKIGLNLKLPFKFNAKIEFGKIKVMRLEWKSLRLTKIHYLINNGYTPEGHKSAYGPSHTSYFGVFPEVS